MRVESWETEQPPAQRFRQHHPRESEGKDESSVAEHFRLEHEHQGCRPNFMITRIGKGGGFVYRKCVEAVLIKEKGPEINKLKEGS